MSEGPEKKRCAHGVFKYGECAECREKMEGIQAAVKYAEQLDEDWDISKTEHRAKVLNKAFENRKQKHTLGDCLDEAKATICGARQDVYGSPEDSFALIAKYWNIYLQELRRHVGTHEFTMDNDTFTPLLDAKDIAHMMILFKMARVQGQAPKRDNLVDICGYAAIAADRF